MLYSIEKNERGLHILSTDEFVEKLVSRQRAIDENMFTILLCILYSIPLSLLGTIFSFFFAELAVY